LDEEPQRSISEVEEAARFLRNGGWDLAVEAVEAAEEMQGLR